MMMQDNVCFAMSHTNTFPNIDIHLEDIIHTSNIYIYIYWDISTKYAEALNQWTKYGVGFMIAICVPFAWDHA